MWLASIPSAPAPASVASPSATLARGLPRRAAALGLFPTTQRCPTEVAAAGNCSPPDALPSPRRRELASLTLHPRLSSSSYGRRSACTVTLERDARSSLDPSHGSRPRRNGVAFPRAHRQWAQLVSLPSDQHQTLQARPPAARSARPRTYPPWQPQPRTPPALTPITTMALTTSRMRRYPPHRPSRIPT